MALQRNRLAHRYLNFRWQAIKIYTENQELIVRMITIFLDEEEKKIWFKQFRSNVPLLDSRVSRFSSMKNAFSFELNFKI